MTSISIDGLTQLNADLGEISGKVERSMVRAINRALGSGRTVMVREMAKDMRLLARDVRDAMPIREATPGRPMGQFGASLKRIPLIKFGARQTLRGVTANTGEGRKVYPGTFIATMGSGHTGVFARHPTRRMRSNPKRQAIVERRGPSLGHVFKKYQPMGQARVIEAFEQNFDHEMAFRTVQGLMSDAGTD